MRVKKLLIKVELENGAECNYIDIKLGLVLNGTHYIANGEFTTTDFERVIACEIAQKGKATRYKWSS